MFVRSRATHQTVIATPDGDLARPFRIQHLTQSLASICALLVRCDGVYTEDQATCRFVGTGIAAASFSGKVVIRISAKCSATY